jgi:hypothetical protein
MNAMEVETEFLRLLTPAALGDRIDLNEHDVARITGLSVASVRRWRLLKIGPRATKIGGGSPLQAGRPEGMA